MHLFCLCIYTTISLHLIPCMLGNFAVFFCLLLIFFKINLFKKFFEEVIRVSKQFGYRTGLTFVMSDLGPNCFQRLSADNIRPC